jgi:hypothetical protein
MEFEKFRMSLEQFAQLTGFTWRQNAIRSAGKNSLRRAYSVGS